jgi:hypothetical protein
MEAADMTGSRLLERKATNGEKISYDMVSAGRSGPSTYPGVKFDRRNVRVMQSL